MINLIMNKDAVMCYSIGSYVYDVYKDKIGKINITGDIDHFYVVLGWHVQQSHPLIYKQLSTFFDV